VLASPPINYLVELFHPQTLAMEDADICTRLDVALEKVYAHLSNFTEMHVSVDVSCDEDGLIEGVGFFDANLELISCVTTYHHSRDTEEPSNQAIAAACAGELSQMPAVLAKIFNNR
jgi:hypothetical protein